jgi:predicted Co/Zn/Cd cation transporter (cation efflux family)
MRAADELIDSIVNSSRIPSGMRRRDLERELRCHIEDFILAAREAGRGQDEIEKLVLANFGDPSQIAQGFAWVYRHERRRLRVFAYTLSTLLLAGSLLAAILAVQAGLGFGFGTPIMRVLAGKHTVMEALDILASVAVYLGLIAFENLFESRRFQKAAFLLTGILAVLIASCVSVGLHTAFLVYGLVNGVFFRAIQIFVTPTIVRLSIVAICFPLAGLVLALLRSPVSQIAAAQTCASWLAMGAGYQLMTHLAARIDAALFNGLQRIQAGS